MDGLGNNTLPGFILNGRLFIYVLIESYRYGCQSWNPLEWDTYYFSYPAFSFLLLSTPPHLQFNMRSEGTCLHKLTLWALAPHPSSLGQADNHSPNRHGPKRGTTIIRIPEACCRNWIRIWSCMPPPNPLSSYSLSRSDSYFVTCVIFILRPLLTLWVIIGLLSVSPWLLVRILVLPAWFPLLLFSVRFGSPAASAGLSSIPLPRFLAAVISVLFTVLWLWFLVVRLVEFPACCWFSSTPAVLLFEAGAAYS